MPNSVDFSGRPFHFIGIGGIGMSALAYILANRNLPIYGSDLKTSHITRRLQNLGTHIFWSQEASNFEVYHSSADSVFSNAADSPQLDPSSQDSNDVLDTGSNQGDHRVESEMTLPQVVCSTAIHPDNSEYRAALELGCPIFHRSDILSALIQEYQSIGVAGTHGKTTTSSLIGFMLLNAGLDPTVIIGGEVNAWEGNARVGQSPYLVAEADESDGSLVKLKPAIGIITNIELDHPDHYDSLDQVVSIFETFSDNCQTLIGCIDCATVRDRIRPKISYSLDPNSGADYTVTQVKSDAQGSSAQVWERGQCLGELKIKLLGQHNLQNALSAVAVGRLLGLEFNKIASAMADFDGAKRRFEHRGYSNGIVFVDDYAHHPSEIRATLAAARLRKNPVVAPLSSAKDPSERPIQRVVAIFQPHRYSRTQTFLADFAQCFNDADRVVITEIYSAGERKTHEIDGQKLADLIAQSHPHVHYQPSLESVKILLSDLLQPGDLALFLGAGNLNQIIPEVIASHSVEHYPMELVESQSA